MVLYTQRRSRNSNELIQIARRTLKQALNIPLLMAGNTLRHLQADKLVTLELNT